MVSGSLRACRKEKHPGWRKFVNRSLGWANTAVHQGVISEVLDRKQKPREILSKMLLDGGSFQKCKEGVKEPLFLESTHFHYMISAVIYM